MATTTGVFLPDEQEQQIPKKSPQSVRANGDEVKIAEPAKADNADPANLSEQELKSAIMAAWKKHEELAKADLAPLLYWLRERLRAQGARNDLTNDKDRGWEVWVTDHLEISRRTADRWCAWYADQAGLTTDGSTSGQVTGSDAGPWEDILNDHENERQIALNFWVPTAMHAQYSKALTTLQKKFACKDKKEALVRGVIYAAAAINSGRGYSGLVGKTTSSQRPRAAKRSSRARKAVRHAVAKKGTLQNTL